MSNDRTNFFDEHFDGPTERFSSPYVTPSVQHPYTEEMVLECLKTIGSSHQSRITRNCRVYIDGALMCPFASSDVMGRITHNLRLCDVDWSEIFGRRSFLIFVNRAGLYSSEMLSASKAFVGAFDLRFGRSGISIEHHLIIGHYDQTPFGVHIDDPTDRVFHFNLGPCCKRMSLWPRQEFLTSYGGDAARLRSEVNHAEPSTYLIPAGSSFFLPADFHHVGSSQDGISIVVALAFSRQSENLLLREALQEMIQLVASDISLVKYYREFAKSPNFCEDELFARVNQVGLEMAHRHAVARRISNNSFTEIPPKLEFPNIETVPGSYMRTDTRIEVIEAGGGAYVYSGGHRAFLVSNRQVRELNHLLSRSEFEIGQNLGHDAESFALRVWLTATGAAQRRSNCRSEW